MTELYDGIMFWATALNETLENGEDPTDGVLVSARMWNRQLTGMSGNITIDNNGDLDCSYVLFDMDPDTGNFMVRFNGF